MPAVVSGNVWVNVPDVHAQMFDSSHPTVTQRAVKCVTRIDVAVQAALACKHFGTIEAEEGQGNRSIGVDGVPVHPLVVFQATLKTLETHGTNVAKNLWKIIVLF